MQAEENSLYIHIPYCLQRCRYCDFTTFEVGTILPPEEYIDLLNSEIKMRSHLWGPLKFSSIYFGGGTPSLLSEKLLTKVLDTLLKAGHTWTSASEITLEINPATVNANKLNGLIRSGFNRFSVGAQTFDDQLLKVCGRKHSSEETRASLDLLSTENVNYSFDLLFALPGQTLQQLERDLDEVAQYNPAHLSAYCLTVPESHPMSRGRPLESVQVDMFNMIETRLQELNTLKYEISNFAKPGFESRHNLVYWTNRPFWGVGVSAHSYSLAAPFGQRFWNPKDLRHYVRQVRAGCPADAMSWPDFLPAEQIERLSDRESLTDVLHMHLRLRQGLPKNAMHYFPYSPALVDLAQSRLKDLVERKLVVELADRWTLTPEGEMLNNVVLERLTFLDTEVRNLSIGTVGFAQ